MTEDRLNRNKVLLGMSGGVDSTTAALLLKEAGYEVIGCYFDVGQDRDESDWAQAEKAGQELGIEVHYVNVHQTFEKDVINPFCEEYSCGRTPNPCIKCNPTIKFPTLIGQADLCGAYYIATGHYARPLYSEELGRWVISRGENHEKDQTYMLYRLPEEILKRLILPLGDIASKDQVRGLAGQAKLSSADQKDSQGICFLPDQEDYNEYLMDRGYKHIPGDFVDLDGNVLGQHRGIMNYTLGQRKGLGMSFGRPMYVVAIDSDKNQVVLGDNKDLFTKEVIIDDLVGDLLALPEKMASSLVAKTRHVIKRATCRLEPVDEAGQVKVIFEEGQRAVTPGQSLVIYSGDLVVGGGIVKTVKL